MQVAPQLQAQLPGMQLHPLGLLPVEEPLEADKAAPLMSDGSAGQLGDLLDSATSLVSSCDGNAGAMKPEAAAKAIMDSGACNSQVKHMLLECTWHIQCQEI
jgi:hypothetical protein